MSDTTERRDAFFELGTMPMVFIGLGGSGGEVVARIKDQALQQYPDPDDPARKLLQFLAVDADVFEHLPASVRGVLDKDHEFLFIGGLNPRRYVLEAMRAPDSDSGRDLRAWLGDPPDAGLLRHFPNEEITDGARRFRQLGRLLLYARQDRAAQAIEGKLRAAGALRPALATHGDLSEKRKVHVFLVSGTCGGTGSGIFFDVLHMVDRALYSQTALQPEVNAALILPGIHLAKYRRSTALPHYRANGWAFWEELRYLLREPEAFNSWVMDATSRGWQAQEGSGLPAHADPLHWAYLFDHEIPGLGFFSPEDLSSFYASVAKAMFHHITALSGHLSQSVESTLANVRGRRAEADVDGAQRVGCSVGFSEICFPAREVRTYLGFELAREAIDRLLAPPESHARAEAVNRLESQIAEQVLDPLTRELNEVADTMWAQCSPQRAAAEDGGGKIDPDRMTASLLDQWRSGVEQGAARAETQLRLAFAARREELLRRFSSILDEELRTASGYSGLGLTQAAFVGLDDRLEARLQGHRAEKAEREATASDLYDRLVDASKGSLMYAVLHPRGLFSKATSRTEGVDQLLRTLEGLYDARAGAIRAGLLGELLLELAGEPGDRVPQVAVLDPATGRETRRIAKKAVLDEFEDAVVSPAAATYRRIAADGLSDKRLAHTLWAYEGRAVTSRYVPSGLDVISTFRALPLAQGLLNGARNRSTEEMLKGLLTACPPAELPERPFAGSIAAIAEWASAQFDTDLAGVNVFERLSDESDGGADAISKALASAIPPLALSPPHGQGAREEVLRVVQAPDKVQGEKAVGGFKPNLWTSSPATGIYLLHQAFVIPLSRVRSFDSLRGDYFRRRKSDSFPHVGAAFNATGAPGAEKLHREALEVYARARAVDAYLATGEPAGRADRLAALGLADEPGSLKPFAFADVKQVRSGRRMHRAQVWVARVYARDDSNTWTVQREVELTSAADETDPRLAFLLGYVSSGNVVDSHRAVLEDVQRHDAALLDDCTATWRDTVLRPALDDVARELRARPGAEPAATLHRWLRMLLVAAGGEDAVTAGPSPI